MKAVKPVMLPILMAAAAPAAMAYEAGDVLVRFGPALVAPDSSSSSVLGDVAEVEDAEGFGISATYMVTDLVGVELLGALPFQHNIEGTGALDGVRIGSTRHLPPTLLVHVAPDIGDFCQPYVGVGINYTTFFREKTSPQLDNALAADTDLSLSDSTGLAWELGVDVPLKDQLSLNLSVWNIDIDTTARVKANGVTAATVDVEIDPWVYMLGVGMQF